MQDPPTLRRELSQHRAHRRAGEHHAMGHPAVATRVDASALAVVLACVVVVNCGRLGQTRDAHPSAPSPVSAPPNAQVPAVCQKTGQRPGERHLAKPRIASDAPPAEYTPYTYKAHHATIRILSMDPLIYEAVDPGMRANPEPVLGPTSITTESTPVATRAATTLGQLSFGELLRAQFLVPEGIYNAAPPPIILAGVQRGAVPAVEAPLLAEWRPEPRIDVRVYADGRAFVSAPPRHFIDATLSAAELDRLFETFGAAGFDALPAYHGPLRDGAGAVVLACERYQQVEIDAHQRALGPVLSAFARIHAQALAQARPVLLVEKRGWHAPVLSWPSAAPPVGMLHDLQGKALKQARAGDYSSPVYWKLPTDLLAAFPAARPWPVVVEDRGERWEVTLRGCDTCRPGTYSTIYAQHATFREAPDWVPDLASIGAEGLLLDSNDPRYEALRDNSYRQRGDVYSLRLKEVVPSGSSAPGTP